MRVVGYCRVSTDEQGDSGAGLEAQRHAIEADVDKRGWELVTILEDVSSGKTTRNRKGLEEAVALIRDGKADALMCTKLDRLTRSVADFSAMLERFNAKHWGLILLDLGI